MASAHAATIGPGRPRELQDPLNHYVYHPLAALLARALLPTGITANAVSVGSAATLIASALAYTELAGPTGVVLGFALMLLWHVIDGADGDLARLKGTASSTGELVDGVCDYLGNVVMYFAFAFLLDDTLGAWAWALALGAAASHVVQTNHAETQRRLYLWRAYGVPWLRNARASHDAVFRRECWFTRYFGFWAVGYVWLSNRMTPGANPIDAALAKAQGHQRESRRIRRLVRRVFAPSHGLAMALGANPKTFLIAASMAMGSPVYYFLAMIFGVNLILVASILHHKALTERVAAALSPT
jgi:phosphatidylglycerophosphate synthase